jgi:trimethylamine--corrinoid protein Co-methyltransferase
MSSGSAELGLMMAGCAQMAGFYGLPGSVAAGMSDSKLPDAQSGSEKAYTLTLAAHAGSTLILETAGMQSSLMSTSLESYVIDNDMLGSVQRTVRGIEVNDETLAFDVIRSVALAKKGHFLGHPQTIKRMESDYFYPAIGDRSSPTTWEDGGAKDILERARERVREILHAHYPDHINLAVDDKIRNTFNILLPREAMQPGNGRW